MKKVKLTLVFCMLIISNLIFASIVHVPNVNVTVAYYNGGGFPTPTTLNIDATDLEFTYDNFMGIKAQNYNSPTGNIFTVTPAGTYSDGLKLYQFNDPIDGSNFLNIDGATAFGPNPFQPGQEPAGIHYVGVKTANNNYAWIMIDVVPGVEIIIMGFAFEDNGGPIDAGDIGIVPPNSVYDIVSSSNDHTILKAAIDACSLDGTLQGAGPFTVFAPTDAAFTAYLAANGLTAADLLANPKLSNILLHHVVSGNVLSTSLSNGEVTTLSGLDVTVDLTNGVVIDNAKVTVADIAADNGVVHVINDILLPTYDDVTEVITTSPEHTVLLQALQAANLVSTLQGAGPFTVFAPTDAAFTAFLTANNLTAAALLADPNLSSILLNHVVGAKVLSTGLSNGNVTTLNNTDVVVDLSNGVMIDNATVTTADIVADNGVVHVIDDILVPTNPSTGLFNDSKNAEFKIYPNPTQNNLKINLGKNEKYSIMNITGSIVQSGQLVNGVVNVEGLKKGIYLIQVNNEEGLRDAKFTKE